MRQRVLWAVVGIAVFMVLAAAMVYRTEPAIVRQPLADGSVMILRGVTYGREHRIALGNALQRIAGRFLPPGLAKRIGVQVLVYSNAQPCLVVWTEQQKPGSTRRPTGGYTATPVIVADDAGTEFEQVGSSFASQGSNYLVEAFPFGAFPRSSGMVNIRVKAFDYVKKGFLEAKFRVANPVFTRVRPQPPTAYPVRVEQAELAFVLHEFSSCAPPGGNREEAWMRARYEILENGNPTNDWRVRGISIWDDAGGGYSPSAIRALEGESRTNMEFRGGLGTNTEWRLRFSVERSTLSSNELVTIRNVPVPGRSEGRFEPVSVEAQGVTLQVTGFRGSQYVFASFAPATEGLRLELLRLVDDQGREGRVTVTGLGANAQYHFGVAMEKDAKAADLTFALRRERKIEVRARPKGGAGG
jgi:hypothetical protein